MRALLRPRSVLAKARDRVRGRRPTSAAPELAGQKLLRAFAEFYPAAYFIEVGSNDGDQHDHLKSIIRGGGWRGIMVEPVPYVFARLQDNYGGIDGITLENLAIADRVGTLPFYHLAQAGDGDGGAGLPPWYDAIGSFSRDAIMSHEDKIPDIADRLVCTEVPCITFDALCRKNGVDRLDLLLIDTEGYDWELLQHIDLTTYQPHILIYEHYHLPSTERVACRHHLEEHGYFTLQEGFDTWCLHRDADPRLIDVWRRLTPGAPAFSADENPA